jgi:replicative superfamily II helicase
MHRTVYQDSIGSNLLPAGGEILSCVSIPEVLRNALMDLYGTDARFTEIQRKVVEAGVFERNGPEMVVCAPTNSGKSLAGWFQVFATVLSDTKEGQRSVFVAPMKAIAEEKRIELEKLCSAIHKAGGPRIRQAISTGDYATTGEFLDSPPPENGEILICTPERLDLVLRQESGRNWARAVGSYVFDEFHLLGDRNRGPVMDRLLTHLLIHCGWSKIMALSATIGNPGAVTDWLANMGRRVEVIEDTTRRPVLDRYVIASESKEDWLRDLASQILPEKERSLLVFVSTRARTRTVAKRLGEVFGESVVAEFHAGLTTKGRMARVEGLVAGSLRCVVATTSLKMGVNLPVTDVVILDGHLSGDTGMRRLGASDIAQMTGRAGRGRIPGSAWILAKGEDADAFADSLGSGVVEDLEASWIDRRPRRYKKLEESSVDSPKLIRQSVLTELASRGNGTPEEIADHLSHCFAARGTKIPPVEVRESLDWLTRKMMCFVQEGSRDRFEATKIGRVSASSGISPETGAIFTTFLRALLKMGESNPFPDGRPRNYLSSLSEVDLLFLACASHELRGHALKLALNKDSFAKVSEYIETLAPEEKPLVNLWRDGKSKDHPTRRLLATLALPHEADQPDECEKTFWALMSGAVLLHSNAKGENSEAIAKRWKIEGGDFEGAWRPLAIWMVRTLSSLCDPKRAYRMRGIRMKCLELAGSLAIGCPLGALLRIRGLGLSTVQRLKDVGFLDLTQLREAGPSILEEIGVKGKPAEVLRRMISRKSR